MNAPLKHIAEGLPRRRLSVADFVRMGEIGLIAEHGAQERLTPLFAPADFGFMLDDLSAD